MATKKKPVYVTSPEIQTESIMVLNSGGLDSAIVLAAAYAKGYEHIHSLFVDYGQLAADNEGLASAALAAHYNAQHHTEKIDLNIWGSISALTDAQTSNPIIPNRNFVLFALAATYCDTLMIPAIAVGWDAIYSQKNKILESVVWDAHRPFLMALCRAYDEGSRLGWIGNTNLEIEAPLLNRTKLQNVKFGKTLSTPFDLAWSCMQGNTRIPCGTCVKCQVREEVAEIGVPNTFDYERAISLVPSLRPKVKTPRKKKESVTA